MQVKGIGKEYKRSESNDDWRELRHDTVFGGSEWPEYHITMMQTIKSMVPVSIAMKNENRIRWVDHPQNVNGKGSHLKMSFPAHWLPCVRWVECPQNVNGNKIFQIWVPQLTECSMTFWLMKMVNFEYSRSVCVTTCAWIMVFLSKNLEHK